MPRLGGAAPARLSRSCYTFLLRRCYTDVTPLYTTVCNYVQVPGMGSAYKAFALTHADIPADAVPGFPPCEPSQAEE